ncbi:MAG TPA: AAA family ATPase [Gaiellales bacterium]|jgi:DNA-binding CsgD family transcriptional regulator|nr:AAA family ATPase [Gaiellales bacterium]
MAAAATREVEQNAFEQGDLLERDEPLATLTSLLCSAGTGTGSLALVSGEAGVGKTALTRAFCTRHMSTRVLWGACDRLFTPRTLGPLMDVAEETGGALASRLASHPVPGEVFAALLGELRSDAPTVLVLEDLHWADEATLDMLALLGRRAAQVPALVIGTYRDDEVGVDHPLQLVLGELATEPTIARIQLAPLSPVAVGRLAAHHGADEGDLFAKTRGNPFFLSEVLAGGGDRIPDTVRDAVLARASRMTTPERRLLEAVAAVPSRIELDLLDAILPAGYAQLERCLGLGMLEYDHGHVQFRHELARVAIEEATPPDRRQQLNAAALNHLAAASSWPDPARLAHHAAAAADAAAVLRYAPLAARRAAELGAHSEAARQFRHALPYIAELAPGARAELLYAYAYECYLTDQLDEAHDSAVAAAALSAELGLVLRHGAALTLAAPVMWWLGRTGQALEICELAVSILEAEPPGAELAGAYATLGRLLKLDMRPHEAIVWSQLAMILADALDELDVLAAALNDVGSSLLFIGDEGGVVWLERSLEIARACGAEEHVLRAVGNLAGLLLDHRRLAEAERYIDEGERYLSERDLHSQGPFVTQKRARCLLAYGDWAGARAIAEKALRRPPPTRFLRLGLELVVALVAARRGDPDAEELLAAACSDAQDDPQQMAMLSTVRAEASWLAGDNAGVLAATDVALPGAIERRDPWLAGELVYWRFKAGLRECGPDWIAAPYRAQIDGDSAEAARIWGELGYPYEAALAQAESHDEAVAREALDALHRLGAARAALAVARKLRAAGVRGVARGPRRSSLANPAHLTARELEVLSLLTDRLRSADIAARLYVTPKTVEHHIAAIYRKLEVNSREAARDAAIALGIAEP